MPRPITFLVLLIAIAGCRPSRDSSLLLTAPWATKALDPALVWRHYSFPSLFDTVETVNVLDLQLDKRTLRPRVVFDPHILRPTHEWAEDVHALAAVNGNFFHIQEGGSVCFLKIDGKIIDTSRTDLPPKYFLDELDDAALTITADGAVSIRQCPSGGWKSLDTLPTILSGGPPLLLDKKPIPLITHSFNDHRYARTGIGLTSDNHLLVITVDGRGPHSGGVTLNEFRKIFQAFHCKDAMNLDGGGSTTMFVAGEGIVNHPTDKSGERKVANILAIVRQSQ